ncbi:Glycosyltransferase like family [Burkholderiaceae bacterium]
MNNLKIRFVVATRVNRVNFFTQTATGKSLSLYNFPFVELDLYELNKEGLPAVYNRSIEKAKNDPAILVFIHDDVHLCDFYWTDQMLNGLNQFDIIGVAGNKRRLPNQPSWAFIDHAGTWDASENLSGVVGHGNGYPPQVLDVFGPPAQQVKILDGVIYVCHSELLKQKKMMFDERFDFHFYDLDFCRQAEEKGVRMGTWTISLIHESKGNFKTAAWETARSRYLEKWGD